MTSPLNFASKKSRYFWEKHNINPPFRVNSNPIVDVLDVADPYEKRCSSAPWTNFEKAHLQVQLCVELGDPEEKNTRTLFLTVPQVFLEKCRVCPTQHAFWEKSWGAVKKSMSVEPAPGQRPVADPFISVGTSDGSVGVSYRGYPGNMFRPPPGSVGAQVYLISVPTYRRYPGVRERRRRQQ